MLKTVHLAIFICLLTVTQICFADNKESQYPIRVEDGKTGAAIKNAWIRIEILGSAPINVFTDSNGFTRIFIEEIRSGEPCRLTVHADGYKTYVQNIDLNTKILTHVVQLDLALAPELYHNRFGLAAGYTRFEDMDDLTYIMGGAVYQRRFISFNLFDLACYGYLDLTIMTSLNSEKTIDSGIFNDETTFGRATSYSVNYIQSVQFASKLSLILEIGFQRLDVDLKLDDNWDKLTKDSLLLGGGFEYNYEQFFIQTDLGAVIGEDKNLGHDLNATIKVGINF